MEKRIRVAVDAMGGDYAPEEIVKGAVEAAGSLGVDIILVGTKDAIEAELEKTNYKDLNVSIVEATEVIKDDEEPAFAVMRKPNSSVALAASMVKKGDADAMISAGSTGAVMVAALQYVGALPGIDRPMVGGAFLQLAPKTIVLDLGANVGCQPYHLVDFAVAGTVYARTFMGIENPSVGLLNVGAEEGKGNDMVKEAYPMLQKSGLNFIGNVEGMDIPFARADVIITDGFVGNILVKFCEGLGRLVSKWLKSEFSGKVSEPDIESASSRLYHLLSPGVAIGGGPLWGVNGVVAVSHGSSRASQITGTINQAKLAVESGFVPQLATELEKVKGRIAAG
ncbi:MAG: phosphate acyltransferase PlsX [Dehalococcoidia bacterium]|jgi:glycerol-3-phosphate acyltransferase PlsX